MQSQPVKPGTPVYIPKREEPDPRKQTKKHRELTDEEKLLHARKWNRCLAAAVAVLLVAVTVLGVLLHTAHNPKDPVAPRERNYTYVADLGR